MRCKSCGQESAEGARFCVNCGQPLSDKREESGTQTKGLNIRRSYRIVIAAIFIVSAVAFGVIVLRGFGTTDAKAKIMESMKEANGGVLPELSYDGEELVSIGGTFSSVRVLSDVDALSAFSEVAPLFGVYLPNKELEFQREECNEETGDVTYVFAYKAAQQYVGSSEGSDSDADQLSQVAAADGASNGEGSQDSQEIVVIAGKDGKVRRAERRIAEEVTVDVEKGTVESAYAAYAAKLEEYIERYGSPKTVTETAWYYDDIDDYYSGDGVCLAELVDFDCDGIEELHLAYYNPANENTESAWSVDGLPGDETWTGHDPGAYVIEVWSFINGEVRVAYQGKASMNPWAWPEEWSTPLGYAFCGRATLSSGDGVGTSNINWIRLSGRTAASHYDTYASELWSIKGGESSLEHRWENIGEYSLTEMIRKADGEETELSEHEWLDSLNVKIVDYPLMDSSEDEHVSECIELTKNTMERLGIELPEDDAAAIDVTKVFTPILDSVKKKAQETSFFSENGVLYYQYADFDGDGIDELFVSYLSGTWNETTNYIYKVQGQKAVRIFDHVRRGCGFICCYPQTQTLVYQMRYKGMVFTWYYQYSNGTFVQRAAEFDSRNYTGGLGYESSENTDITDEEYRSIVANLEKGDEVKLPLELNW